MKHRKVLSVLTALASALLCAQPTLAQPVVVEVNGVEVARVNSGANVEVPVGMISGQVAPR